MTAAASPHVRLAQFTLLLCLLATGTSVTAKSLRNQKPLSPNKKAPRKLTFFPLIPGDSAEARRRRRQRQRRQLAQQDDEEEEDESPLELQRDALYEGYGVHYVDLWVGCPTPQRVTVIVDTGSSVTGFPCAGCHHCGGDADSSDKHVQYHTDALFQQDESTCFETVESPEQCWVGTWKASGVCRASKHYSEGSSWEAFEAMDTVYTGGDHNQVTQSRVEKESFQLHFGCQDKVTGLFETQLADGIMGLYNSEASFWHQAYSQKAIEKKMFSLCFSEPGRVERTGTPAGAMVLGGTDTRLHATEMVYAQQMSHEGKYVLHLEKVFLLNGETDDPPTIADLAKVQIFEEDLNNGSPGVILDSGTTATYLTQQLQRRFLSVFNSMVPEELMVLGSQKEYALTRRQVEQLPTIVFQMKAWQSDEEEDVDYSTTTIPGMVGQDLDKRHAGKSILVAMPPAHYLSRTEDDSELSDPTDLDEVAHYKLNVYFSKKKNKGGVLGANFMRGHDILFDVENQRIGFAQSDCEYSVLVEDEEEN